jgi:catalase
MILCLGPHQRSIKYGRLVLNRNPLNYFAETEQVRSYKPP